MAGNDGYRQINIALDRDSKPLQEESSVLTMAALVVGYRNYLRQSAFV
jgi:hypothetical protein